MAKRLHYLASSFLMSCVAAVALMFMLVGFTTHQAAAQTFTILHSFTGTEGALPYAGVTLDDRGDLYGTTTGGGLRDGVVYELKRAASGYVYNLLFRFISGGPATPRGGLVFGPDGAFYGASGGGEYGLGAVYELRPPVTICGSLLCYWRATTLYSFQGYPDGGYPDYGQVAIDGAGNIYGTTEGYAANAYGMVYQLSRSANGWTENILYNFRGHDSGDGARPRHSVIIDSMGNLYGTTSQGGAYADVFGGTVFQLVPSGNGWTEHVLASFPQPGLNTGEFLECGLIMDSAGNLYGATETSPNGNGSGSVFELSPSLGGWQLTVIHAFNERNGTGPIGNLAMDSAGNLYGTTWDLGAFGYGNVFKLTRSSSGWIYTDLHDFSGGDDGAIPIGDLTVDAEGNIFGTVRSGGRYTYGVLWEITP